MSGIVNRSQRYRFRYCLPERAVYARVLCHYEPDLKRQKKGIECGTHQVAFMNTRTGEVRLAGNYCEARTCPMCFFTRKRHTSIQLSEWLRLHTRNNVRMMTVACASNDDPLGQQIDYLVASFKRMRAHRLWREKVNFGKAIIEVTYNKARKQWHPHLHILAVGTYFPQAKLSNAWAKASGGNPVVDIRKIEVATRNPDDMADYLGKHPDPMADYLGKPPSIDETEEAVKLIGEYYTAIRNRRMLLSFGGAPPLPPLPKSEEPPEEGEEWKSLGTLEDIFQRLDLGDTSAEATLAALASKPAGEMPLGDP